MARPHFSLWGQKQKRWSGYARLDEGGVRGGEYEIFKTKS